MNAQWFTIKKIRHNLYGIGEFFHWEKVISYFLVGKKQAILFDTGMGYRPISDVIQKITKVPVFVLLTHAHWDHIGGISLFSSNAVFCNYFERKLLQKGFSSDSIPELCNESFFEKPFVPREYSLKGVKIERFIEDGEVFSLDNLHIESIHTSGHTPGSTSFFIKELNILVTGDTVYPGPLYAYLPESNINAYTNSLQKLKKISTPETVLLPGHNAMSCSVRLLNNVTEGFKLVLNNKVKGNNKVQYVEYLFNEFSILSKI